MRKALRAARFTEETIVEKIIASIEVARPFPVKTDDDVNIETVPDLEVQHET